MADNILSSGEESAQKFEEAVVSAKNSVEALTKSVFSSGKGFEGLVKSTKELKSFAKTSTAALGKLGEHVPGVKSATGAIAGLGGMVSSVIGIIADLGDVYMESLNAFDSFSAGLREMDDDMFSLAATFGGTFEEAKSFTDGIGMLSRQVSGADFAYISPAELKETATQLAGNRIALDRFSDTVISSAGTMDLLTTATLQAGASGLGTQDYFAKLGDAIMKQGLDSQQAAEQMASFRDVADETGLTVQSVADTLNNLANSFSKLGLSADFGRPLVTGFARTLDDMGLGIENAIELSSDLSSALAGLTTDYAMAFVTAQRGGMDLGGGGVLGAGIGLQARLLEAQQSGDEQAQADISRDLVTGLKDTIASFAGGQIVTVQEADANPALAATFYTQTKLLQDMYGIDQQSSARTLDLLSDLDGAIKSGNEDAADKLAEQIETSIQNRDETLDLMDKQNALTASILAETMVQTRALMFLPRAMGEESIMGPANEMITSGLDFGQDKLLSFQEKMIGQISEMGQDDTIADSLAVLLSEQKASSSRAEGGLIDEIAEAAEKGGAGGRTERASGQTDLIGEIRELVRVLKGRVIGDKSTSVVPGG
jgi:hypothetical protein